MRASPYRKDLHIMQTYSEEKKGAGSAKRQIVRTLIVMGVFTAILAGVKTIQIMIAIAEGKRHGPPPEAVTTVVVTNERWRDTFTTVGSFAAVKGATLSTQESGNVARIGFESGDKVSEGQVLIELDRSVEEANLQGALARLDLAKQNLARAQTLRTQSAVSAANFEDAQARAKQAEAEVRSIRGVIERKTILAPFAGRAGIRAVNVSQYVTAGTPLVPLYSVDPIHFNFSVPQQIAPALRGAGERARISVDAFPGKVFEGLVSAVNPNINEATRSVDVQATIPNGSEELLPGMFGEVRIELGAARDVVALPVTSVQYAPYGNSVYVLEREEISPPEGAAGMPPLRKVRQQIVQLGDRRGDFVAVLKGLTVGDEVVTLGTFKLRPGAMVFVRGDQRVPASLNPEVKNS
jgi:membrane fusion protein (multidrug efflux system)